MDVGCLFGGNWHKESRWVCQEWLVWENNIPLGPESIGGWWHASQRLLDKLQVIGQWQWPHWHNGQWCCFVHDLLVEQNDRESVLATRSGCKQSGQTHTRPCRIGSWVSAFAGSMDAV
jgi:hypothetical protein